MTRKVYKPHPIRSSTSTSSTSPALPPAQAHLTGTLAITAHKDEVWDIAFSHDGTRLASSGKDRMTVIYDVEDDFAIVRVLSGHSAGIGAAVWSPNDEKIVTCSQDGTARLWDTASGDCLDVLKGFKTPVTGCVWYPDGKSFVTTSLDLDMNLCRWDCEDMPMLAPCNLVLERPKAPLLGAALFTATNQIAAFDNEKRLHIHDIDSATAREGITLSHDLSSMSMSRLGTPYMLLVEKDGLIQMLDPRHMLNRQEYKMKSCEKFVIKATFGGEKEEFVASGSEDGSVYIWGTETGALLMKEMVHTRSSSCNSVAWNPKKHDMIATAGDDFIINILTVHKRVEI